MRFPRTSLLVAVVFGLLLSTSFVRAQTRMEVPGGFESLNRFTFDATAPFVERVGGVAYAPDGTPIVYESGQIRLEGSETSELLAIFDPIVFGSFLVLAPDGKSVYFGETSDPVHTIYSVALDGSGATPVDALNFNFDLAFAPTDASSGIAGRGFISGLGSAVQNAIWLLDDDPAVENDLVITEIPRFSGPITFDDAGNLYCMTSQANFSTEGETGQRLVRFTPAQIAAGIGSEAVDFSTGEVLIRNHEGYFNLVWLDGKIYGSNLGFSTGIGSIEAIDPHEDFHITTFATVVIGEGSGNPSLLVAHPGSQPFEAGAGPDGGRLMVIYGNFVDVSNVAEIYPQLYFIRGYTNSDEALDIADAVFLLDFLFGGGPPPEPRESGDVNADDELDLNDAIHILNYLFLGGPAPAVPLPRAGPVSVRKYSTQAPEV